MARMLLIVAALLGTDAAALAQRAGEDSTSLSPEAVGAIARVEAEIDRVEAATLARLAAAPDNQPQQVELLGKAMLYDKQLSVNRNEACAFCHMPETGFTGPVSELNETTAAYPGSVRARFGNRKPQTLSYAALSPVLHYNPGQGDLVGGNFWDMRATGRRLGNPAAEQAEGPPTNPVEMALPDAACAVYRASQRPYRSLFERVWGAQSFAIDWPADVAEVCDKPGPPPDGRPSVRLGPTDRGLVNATFDQMAQSIANYEASAEVAIHLEIRCSTGGQCKIPASGTTRLRLVPRQGEVQRLPPRRRARRRTAVHRFHGEQYWYARQFTPAILY
jgi:cytochrome c peroxidase